MKVYLSGQKRGVTDAIKRDLRRRSAVEPVIGHAKSDHRMDRNFLKGAHGDAANAILAAAGYNFRRLLAWFAILWRALIMAMLANPADAAIAPFGAAQASLMRRKRRLLHGRLGRSKDAAPRAAAAFSSTRIQP
jgi:DDE family transposase